MKVMISFLSLIIMAAGVLHFFDKFFIPSKGIGYSIVLIILGIVLLASAILNNMLMGFERFFIGVQAVLLIGIANVPFFPTLLTFLPREGPFYAAIVIIIGLIGFLYGILGMG